MTTTSDLDHPMMSGAEIAGREFATVRRGYDPDQVAMYLTAVARRVELLERELRESKQAQRSQAPVAAPAEPPPDPYEELGKRIAGLIGTADSEAARLVDEAKEESSRVLRESRAEADRIRTDAQARAEEARQEGEDALASANAEAEAILSGLSQRRDDLVGRLQAMQTSLLNVAGELDATIERSGDAVDAAGARAKAAARPTSLAGPPWESPEPAPIARPDDGRTDVAAVAEGDALADLVDPRYEDLWVSPDAVDIPDLAAIELDFDTDED